MDGDLMYAGLNAMLLEMQKYLIGKLRRPLLHYAWPATLSVGLHIPQIGPEK